MSQWQPIESAPKDEAVLVCGGDVLYPCTASWSGLPEEEWTLDAQGECFDGVGWPTHWQPLPPPPS